MSTTERDVFQMLEAAADDKKEPKKTRATTTRVSGLEKDLRDFFMLIAFLVSFADPVCSETVLSNAPRLASSWYKLAMKDKNVEKFLRALMAGGIYGEAIITTALVMIPILQHHGMLPRRVQQGLVDIGIAEVAEEEDDIAERVEATENPPVDEDTPPILLEV